jgi:hypothetical protein
MAPYFTNRRYFYLFSQNYILADYIVLNRDEVYNSYDKKQQEEAIKAYNRLIHDPSFVRIEQKGNFEVYTKL